MFLDFIAFHGDVEVGRVQMSDDEFDDNGAPISESAIQYVEFEPRYQRAHIGIEVLRIASECLGAPLKVGNWSPFGDNPLLPSGRALMQKAVELGYVRAEDSNHWDLGYD